VKPTSDKLYGSPEITVVIGRDEYSSGISILWKEPSGGDWPHVRLMFHRRWLDPLPGQGECLSLIIRACEEAIRELGAGTS